MTIDTAALNACMEMSLWLPEAEAELAAAAIAASSR
jgi:hypothetical protein